MEPHEFLEPEAMPKKYPEQLLKGRASQAIRWEGTLLPDHTILDPRQQPGHESC